MKIFKLLSQGLRCSKKEICNFHAHALFPGDFFQCHVFLWRLGFPGSWFFGRSTQNALVFWWFLPPDLTARKTVRLLPPFFAPFAMAFQREVFSTFRLGNVLRATTVCTFSTTQLPKVLWTLNLVYFVHFDFEMCFAPQRCATFHILSGHMALHPPLKRAYFSTLRSHKSLEKTQWIGTFLPFRAPESSFFWLFLSSLLFSSLRFSSLLFASLRFASLLFSSLLWLFPPLLFHLSILSEVWLLNFLRLYNIGVSATSWLSQVPCAHVVCSGKIFNGWSTHHFITSIRMDIDPLELVAGCDEKEGYLSIFTTVLVFFSPCPSIWGKLWQTGIYWLSKPESIFVHQSPTLNYVFVPFHFKGINGYHIIAPLWFLVNIKPIHRWLNQLTPDISLGYPAHIFPQHDMGIGYPSPTHRFPYETGVNFPSVSLSTTPLRPLGMHS